MRIYIKEKIELTHCLVHFIPKNESNEYELEFIINNHVNYSLLCDGYVYLKHSN